MRRSVAEFLQALGLAGIAATFVIAFVAQSFLVQGHSMEPTLRHGEHLLVDKLTYRFREPRRGEIVVFRVPTDPSRKFIKRIIGVPGDLLEFRDGRVFLNGQPLDEPYASGPTRGPAGLVAVPPARYFVLGDNRESSEDSRYEEVGFIPRRHIIGRAVWVYWPVTRAGPVGVPSIAARTRRP